MDARVEEITQGFNRLLKRIETSFIAEVKKDNGDTLTVVDLNGNEYPDVRKIATKGKKGFIVTPKIQSFVTVSRIGNSDDLFVSMFSEIETIEFSDTKGFKCVLENGVISVKNNGYSLRKAFDDILSAISKLTVTTGVGPSGTPINIAEFQAVQQKLNNFLV
jgi:hypothetical protein